MVSPSLVILNIAGGVCLLLWGLSVMRNGMTKGFGASLRKAISIGTGTGITAFITGVFVTILLQSSTATTLIVSGFASQGLISAAAGLSVILGADVGTAVAARVLSFDLSWMFPLLMVIGFLFYGGKKKSGKYKNFGRILIGLSLMLLALMWIRESAEPLKEAYTLPLILQPLQNDVVLAVVVAALLTWIIHSSLALILLLVSLVGSGVVPIELAVVMVLGANVGGCFAPIIATMKDSPSAFRITIGNLMIRLVGVMVAIPFADKFPALLGYVADTDAARVIMLHVLFNLAVALSFLPLAKLVSGVCAKLIPEKVNTNDPGVPKYLDYNALDTPSIALSCATRETLRMADMIENMLIGSLAAFKHNDESLVTIVKEQDNSVDSLYLAVKTYMAKLTEEVMDEEEAFKYVQILSFATNLEHSGDIIDKNLMPSAYKKVRNQQSFSNQGFKEIERIHNMTLESLRFAQSLFISGDMETAGKLLEVKEKMKQAEADASVAHIYRIRGGIPESIATSSLHMDIIRDLRRINTYMSDMAYPYIEGSSGKNRFKFLEKAFMNEKSEKKSVTESAAVVTDEEENSVTVKSEI